MNNADAVVAAMADLEIAEVAWKPSGLLLRGYVRFVTTSGERVVFRFNRLHQDRIWTAVKSLGVPVLGVGPLVR
jgi:hypothetical protein